MSLPIGIAPTETKNITQITLGTLTVFYSYQTPIAYFHDKKLTAIDGSTLTRMTNRHINVLEPDFNVRVHPIEFAEKLKIAVIAACAEIANRRPA